MNMPELPDRFAGLAEDRDRCAKSALAELTLAEPDRTEVMTVMLDGLRADLSKQLVDAAALKGLLSFARSIDLEGQRDAQLGGAAVNVTERRAAMHTALRVPNGVPAYVLGHDMSSDVHLVLGRMADLAHRIGTGLLRGATGEPISTIVNIGIGGDRVPLRQQCRPRRPRIGTRMVRPRGNALHHFVEDLHDRRDNDECTRCTSLVGGSPWRVGSCASFRCGVDQLGRG